MPNALGQLEKSIERFIRGQRETAQPTPETPYRRDGLHVTIGPDRPLNQDFVPSHTLISNGNANQSAADTAG